MKKLIYTLLGLFMVSTGMSAQTEYTILENLTSKLQNADFSADTPLSATVYTYDYNMPDSGLVKGGVGMYGQQPVTGWIATYPTDNIKSAQDRTFDPNARAAGVFAYWNDTAEAPTFGLGGDNYYSPILVDGMPKGPGLGLCAVWGATVQYTQQITLPAGAYLITIPVCNVSGTATMKNMNGFIAADGTEYLSSKQTFTVSDGAIWENDTIAFFLDAETTGNISLGYQSSGVGSGSTPHLFLDCVNLYKVDPTPIIAEKIAAAKAELLAVIEAGENVGADTSAAQAVYDDPNATLDEVNAAIASQKEINETSVQDLSEFFIKNPHFNQDTPIGTGEGITTFDYDRSKNGVSYYGMQPVKYWTANAPADNSLPTDNTGVNNSRACGVIAIGSGAWIGSSTYIVPNVMSDGSASGNVLGFVGCWSAVSQYTQAVSIPAGKYSLTISYYNTGGTSTITKNLMGFIADDGTEYLCDTQTFTVGSWQKMQVSFTLEETTSGYFSVGYAAAGKGSASMPHFFIDGISLNYVGSSKIDPSLFALQAAISTASNINDNNNFNVDLKDELTKAIETGQDLISSQSQDKEANAAATDAINNMIADVNANITAYGDLQTFRNGKLEEAYAKYSEMDGMSDLKAKMDDLMDGIDAEALSDYTWTTEQINAAIASLDPMIKDAVKTHWFEVAASGETLAEPLDITVALDGLSYTYSTTAYSGSSVPDKEWSYGTATNFKTQYGTAEVWNQSPFTITRTLTGMPAGTYTVTTRAFYRTTDNDANYDSYDANTHYAYVWAGHAKTPLANQAVLATDNAEAYTSASQLTESGLYVPSNQQSAASVFTNSDYDEKTLRSVSAVLPETGDLSFGIKADEMLSNSWVIWYSFEIKYNAIDTDVLKNELTGLMEDAAELQENEEVQEVMQAVNNLDKAYGEGEKALDTEDRDQMISASSELVEAINYANESITLTEDLINTLQMYSDLVGSIEIETTDESFLELLSDVTLENESNEKIQEIIYSLKAGWTKYTTSLKGIEEASVDNPFDVTNAIINPSFETGDLTGWTKNDAATGDTGVKENSNSTYAIDNADGSYIFNTWGGSATEYYIQQTLIALPAGYYKVEALVSSDAGNKITISAADASEEVTTTGKTTGDNLSVVFKAEEGAETTIKVSSATWLKADNFRLTYYANDGSTHTAINNVAVTDATSTPEFYNASGIRTNALHKGINIVRYANGTVKKVLVK